MMLTKFQHALRRHGTLHQRGHKTQRTVVSITAHLLCLLMVMAVPAAPVHAAQVTAIEELVVTAQKREESLQEVPISITAISSEELEVLGVRGLGDLIDGVIPALKVSPYPNSPATLNLTMRGTSAADAGSTFTELPVGVYIDGIYLGRAQGAGLDLVDLERLEVLRGPQGTLYGRNSVGGAVNFVTKKPTGEFAFRQTASGGDNWGEWDSITQVDLPSWNWLSGEVRMRASYLRSEDDGWVNNTGNIEGHDTNYWAESKEGWRLATRWEWSDVGIDYTYDGSKNEIAQAFFQIRSGASVGLLNGVSLPGACTSLIGNAGAVAANLLTTCSDAVALQTQTGAGPFAANLRSYLTANDGRLDETPYPVQLAPSDIETVGHGLTVTWDVKDDLQIKFVTSYREVEQRTAINYGGVFGIGLTNATGRGIIDQDQFSQEFQFLGNFLDGKIDYVAGLYYYSENVHEQGIHNRGAFLNANPSNAATTIPAYGTDFPFIGSLAAVFGVAQASLATPASVPAAGALLGNLGRLAALPLLDANDAPVTVDSPQAIIGSATGVNPTYMTILGADVESLAVYAQFDYHMSDKIDFTFGVRFSDDTRDAERELDLRSLATPTCNPAGGARFNVNCTVKRSVESDNLDINLALNYSVSDEVDVYWRYATGYKAAGIDRRSLAFGTFADETLSSIEWGVKSLFAKGRVRWNAAVFTSDYSDKQNTFNDPTPGAQVTDTLTQNARGTVEISGFESELHLVPVDGLRLGINYTYLDWTYPQQQVIYRNGDPAQGVIDNGVRAVQSAPRHSGSFTLDYTFPSFAFGELTLHMDWVSSGPFAYSPRHLSRSDARDIINARVTLGSIPLDFRGNLKVSLWGTNLTDEEYIIYSIDNLQSRVVSDAYGRPRTAGLEVVYEY
jgi:iron complex outermembrane receptor protein